MKIVYLNQMTFAKTFPKAQDHVEVKVKKHYLKRQFYLYELKFNFNKNDKNLNRGLSGIVCINFCYQKLSLIFILKCNAKWLHKP